METLHTIDLQQIRGQLTLLGYEKGDKVYLRGFYPKHDERSGGRKAGTTSSEQLARIATEWQRDGMGIYIVVNGQGHTDAEVQTARAIFYEHDDLPKEIQVDLWKELGLPEPTFQVDTGGKSIHSYWVFDTPIHVSKWKQLQSDLLVMSAADQLIKNPSRVMRLAGCWHFSESGANQSKIQRATGTRYDFDTLRAIIPTNEPPAPVIVPAVNTGVVPLEICLTKDDRALIDGGAGEGSRNASGAKLARNLIGTALRLQYLGIPYSGDPRRLFDEYGARCTPALGSKEMDAIWRSAYKDNPTATLSDDAIQNCVKAWHQKQQINTSVKESLSKKSNDNVVNERLSPSNSDDESVISTIVNLVNSIVTSHHPEFVERLKLNKVFAKYKSEVNRKLFDSIVASARVKFNEVLPEDEIRLKSLMDFSQTKMNWEEVLPAPLARDLRHDADVLNIDPVMIWQSLLPAVSSLGGGFTLDEYGGIPCINWTVTVLPSGDGKTRADKLVFSPLRDMQRAADSVYAEAYKEYKRALKAYEKSENEDEIEPAKPLMRQYLFEIATIQGVVKRLSEQGEGKGSLWARDEIKGLFSSLSQFNKESEARQILLKRWDNTPGSVVRVDYEDSFSYDGALSLTGGIQPDVFRTVFTDVNDPDGMQARFLIACPEARKKRYVDGHCKLAERLPLLYKFINELNPVKVTLAPNAKKYFAAVVGQIGEQIERVSHGGIRAWMKKSDTHILRIALALHLIEHFYSPSTTDLKVLSLETLKRAISFVQYYRSSFHILQEKVSTSDDIASILLQIHTAAVSKHPDGISARDVYRDSRVIQNRAKSAGREVGAYVADLFEKMQQMGYGEVVRKSRSVRFIANKNVNLEKPKESANDCENSSETPPNKDITLTTPVPPKPNGSADNEKNTGKDVSNECNSSLLDDLQETQGSNVGRYCCITETGEIDRIVSYDAGLGKYVGNSGEYFIAEIEVLPIDFNIIDDV